MIRNKANYREVLPVVSQGFNTHLSLWYFNLLVWQKHSAQTAVCWPAGPEASIEPDLTQVDLDDDVSDCIKHKLHILGVCGTGEVGVDLLGVLSFI